MKMTFRARLFVSYIFLIGIPLLILGSLFYRTSLQVVTEQAQKNVYEIVRKNNEIMDIKLQIIDQNSKAMFIDKDLFRIFNQMDPQNEVELFEADRQVTAILSKYFSNNEDVYAYQLWTSYFTFGQLLPQGDPTQSDIYHKAQQAGGKLVWYPTYNFVDMFNQPYLESGNLDFRHLFSATRLLDFSLLSNTTLEKMDVQVERPVLAISFKAEALKSLYDESIPEGSDLWCWMRIKKSFRAVNGKITQTFSDSWVEELELESSGARRMTLKGQAVIVCFDRSEVTGWISIVWMPESSLVGSLLQSIQTSIVLLAAIMGLVALICAFLLQAGLPSPLRSCLLP